jgi:hypothetical protein
LKLKAGIVSCTKSNNSLTYALEKHEAEHMPNILKMRGVSRSYKPGVEFTSSKLDVVYYQAKICGNTCGFKFNVYMLNEIRTNSSILTKRTPHEEG